MADGGHTSKETPKAAQAFADYVALGPGRSLRSLHARYRQQTVNKPPTVRFETLAEWSTTYGWQDRIAAAATERSNALLSEANEIDAESFAITSRKLRERLDYADPVQLDAVVRIRETVRPKVKSGADVNVNVNVAIYQHAQRLAEQLGITAEELIADAERIAAGAWHE